MSSSNPDYPIHQYLETVVSIHDYFVHHIPGPMASEAEVQLWLKAWFVGTTNTTLREVPNSIYVQGLSGIRLNGIDIRELTQKALELRLRLGGIRGEVAAGMAADIQRAKRVEAEEVDKCFAVGIWVHLTSLF
jgi:hypothetical protein